MKNAKTLLFLVLCLFTGCSKEEPDTNENNNPLNNGNGGTNTSPDKFTPITFENSTFTGSVIVSFTDNTKVDVKFEQGKGSVPLSTTGDKTIASLQPANEPLILIGRKEKSNIILNYFNAKLSHRVAVDGFIPIATYAEFQLIRNNESTLANNYKLEADLDLMNIEWTPIGGDKPFSGNFDGDNREILNLKISASSFRHVSLLGLATGGETNFIKNIIIKTGEITGGNAFSAASIVNVISGYTIENCVNHISVKGDQFVGGIGASEDFAGKITKYINCRNYGYLSGLRVAGIALLVYSTSSQNQNQLINCTNYGKVEGVVAAGISSRGIVTDCNNEGDITASSSAAGIVIEGLAKNCTNKGKVYGERTAAGIVNHGVEKENIENCLNFGEITGNEYAAGISVESNVGSIKGCKNMGIVRGKTTGGIGTISLSNRITIQDCVNEGDVYGKNTGGILGAREGLSQNIPYPFELELISVNNSINKGNVHGTGIFVGGVASFGIVSESSNFGIVKGDGKYTGGIVGAGSVNNSKNEGDVYGKGDYTGGVIGGYNGNSTVIDCSNKGKVYGYGKYTGGIGSRDNLTQGSLLLKRSSNFGDVYGYGEHTAGIFAEMAGTAEDCTNTGNIYGLGKYTGGILSYGAVTKSFNFGTVKGDGENTGGILGSGTATECINHGEVIGTIYTGGVVGFGHNVRSSSNTKNVKGGSAENASTGGISGKSSGNIISSSNLGNVSSENIVGGIVGTGGNVFGCLNAGAVSGKFVVGGISGGDSYIYSSYNKGAINGGAMMGGVAGVKSHIFGSYNIGVIGYGDEVGPLIGVMTYNNYFFHNFWGENQNRPNTNERFSAANWPSSKQTYQTIPIGSTTFGSSQYINMWKIGTGSNITSNDRYTAGYWKSLGSWNNGNPIYPKLHFEAD